ncbi:flagellar FlbD family protein [Ruminiclostridium herbifermentans]|uniref:Flagellar FlbD family protein n=1 Tax=Ruminiclostridium herbifermentans TaxID=2488810 RepID=A0A4U7JNQ1_9FIRM|nr:flagellar FlbD family protein [Ruminiclostridium herbifermentans]QNU68394.1 flagellar FlbD family protein [Ruminiclostridium herbifermentans]
MIRLTKLNNSFFVINCELIETIESTPDTVITLNNGKKYVVAESVDEVVERVIEYKKRIFANKYNDLTSEE